MEAIFLYLLKVSFATVVFYLTYHFLFKAKKQFVFNRFYLLLILPVAHLIPLINFPVEADLSLVTVYFNKINPLPTITSREAEKNSGSIGFLHWTSVLTIIYFTGIIFGLIRFIISYYQAYIIQCKALKDVIGNQTVYLSEKNIRAFTFINKIIIGKSILNHPGLATVINHEKVHLRERHFIDLLIIEFLSIFQWFNPFTKVLNKAIRINLEYRADDVVVKKSNMKQYQMALLSLASHRIPLPQFTELNSNNLKNRIRMMQSSNDPKFSTIRKMAVLPVFLLLLTGLSEKTPVIKAGEVLKTNLKAPATGLSEISKKSPDTEINSIDELNRFFSKSLKYPAEARKFGQVGVVTLFFSIDAKGTLTGVYEEQPSRGVFYYPEGSIKTYSGIVVVGYGSDPIIINESKHHPRLYAECKRVIKDLPTINIEKLKGQTVKMEFTFKLK
jgi:beta-lactamase regulating signal transducer with metallopeptidase domain